MELILGLTLVAVLLFQVHQTRVDARSRVLWHDRMLATFRADRAKERKFLLELAQLMAAARTSRSGFELSATTAALKEEPAEPEPAPVPAPGVTFEDGEPVNLVQGGWDMLEVKEDDKQ